MNYPPQGNFGQPGQPDPYGQPGYQQGPYQQQPYGQPGYQQPYGQPPYMSAPNAGLGGPNLPPGTQFAGWGSRFVAYIIDGLILGIPIGVIIGILIVIMVAISAGSTPATDTPGTTDAASAAVGGSIFLIYCCMIPLSIVAVFGYYLFFWTKKNGQTPGKKLMHIRIISTDGSPITFGKAILRLIGYWVSSFIFYIGFLWPLWDPCKQALHDKIANTYVIQE